MKEDGPRLNKLKLIYKKAIQEVLKEEQIIKEVLADPNVSAGDSFFVSDPKADEADEKDDLPKDAETTNKAAEEVFSILKLKLSELFKGKVAANDVESKLNLLDKDISENRISLRDISSEEYIREVFESHIVDPKIEYIDYVEEAKRRSLSRIEALKASLEEVTKEVRLLREENDAYDGIYNSLAESFLETVKGKHSS